MVVGGPCGGQRASRVSATPLWLGESSALYTVSGLHGVSGLRGTTQWFAVSAAVSGGRRNQRQLVGVGGVGRVGRVGGVGGVGESAGI